ncbi:MAG: hypothetical protein WCA36_21910 [Pseudolabrys sp.]
MSRRTHRSCHRAAVLGCAIALLSGGMFITSAAADSGPFAGFPGHWSGSGVLHVKADNKLVTERVRCKATYRLSGSHDVGLTLGCKSDNYKFKLTGNFEADNSHRVTGRWSEESHNIGGTAIGSAHGNRLRLHAEGSAFSAELSMVTHSHRQSVSLDSRGAGRRMTASIMLERR